MMTRPRLLLLDANIVIHLLELGIWETVIERCEIHLARTVVELEARFYEDEDGNRHDFDLPSYAQANRIHVFDVGVSELGAFRAQFDPVYFEKLDPGETESLAYLLTAPEECRLCSADKIVYRVLGNLHRGEQGIALEEVLQQVGLGRTLPRQFTRAFREEWTNKGFQERMGGIGLKP